MQQREDSNIKVGPITFFFKIWSYYVGQAGFELVQSSCPRLPSVGITGVYGYWERIAVSEWMLVCAVTGTN